MLLLRADILGYGKRATDEVASSCHWWQRCTSTVVDRSKPRLAEPCQLQQGAMQEDMPCLHTALAETNPELQRACLFPSYQQLALFAEQHGNLELSDALELFAKR